MNIYSSVLLDELNKRKSRNPRFTLRAFARYLEISPAHLSLLINGKKSLTTKTAAKIFSKLEIGPESLKEMLVDTFPIAKIKKKTPPPS